MARRLCDLSQFSIRAIKAIVGKIMNGATLETEAARRLFEAQFQGADYLEGRAAFPEKREPDLT